MDSPYFTREEFQCKCGCGHDTVDAELLLVLERLRYHFNEPVYISSGCRCEIHNRVVGGSPTSKHVLGRAADIRVRNIEPVEVQDYLIKQYPNQYGIGCYKNFTHIDTRSSRSRWEG